MLWVKLDTVEEEGIVKTAIVTGGLKRVVGRLTGACCDFF